MNILDQFDIHSIVNMVGLSVTDKGHYLSGLCPFHSEKNASFSILKESGFFKCFSCGEQGSLNTLVKRILGKSVYELLDIEEDYEDFVFKDSLKEKEANSRRSFKECTTFTVIGKQVPLLEHPEALSYMVSRGMNEEFIKAFGVTVINEGSINKTYMFKRILFPLMFKQALVGYECRDYTKLAEKKVIYPKGTKVSHLFNYDNLDREAPLIIVEGLMDLVKVWQSYSKNVTGIFGVSLNRTQQEQLKEFKTIILFVDNDPKGLELISKVDEVYPNDFFIVCPPEGCDPNDLSIEQTKDLLDNMVDSTSYFVDKYFYKDEN